MKYNLLLTLASSGKRQDAAYALVRTLVIWLQGSVAPARAIEISRADKAPEVELI